MPAVLETRRTAERRAALKRADHALRLEGLHSSDFAASLFERLARGELSPDEVRTRLAAHYRQHPE